MPTFDLRNIKIAQYAVSGSTVSYTGAQTVGDAMNVHLELRFAEARLYAEGKLAEYLREIIGGTISVGVKYIHVAEQKTLFGASDKSRTIGTGAGNTVAGLEFGADDEPHYVGLACYAPDQIDGLKKFTCIFVRKARFSPPTMTLQTKGQEITFQTPTTTGEMLPDETTGKVVLEVATADTEAKAKSWVDACLGVS